jgi:hypothetical protein
LAELWQEVVQTNSIIVDAGKRFLKDGINICNQLALVKQIHFHNLSGHYLSVKILNAKT